MVSINGLMIIHIGIFNILNELGRGSKTYLRLNHNIHIVDDQSKPAYFFGINLDCKINQFYEIIISIFYNSLGGAALDNFVILERKIAT